MNLLYFIVGNNTVYHTQCYFSILSFLVYKENVNGIYIYTDFPEFYKSLGEKVRVIPLDQQKIDEWRGEHDFFWRVKIKVLEDFSKNNPEQLLVYLDTDTFLYQSSEKLLSALKTNNVSFMHKRETILWQKGHKQHKMWEQIHGKKFGGIVIDRDAYMWNAGVVALPAERQLATIQQALLVCDEMCAQGVTKKLIEQFSLSLMLGINYELRASDDVIGHYWGNKDGWNALISDFLMKLYFENKTIDEMVLAMQQFDFKQIPIYLRIPTQRKRFLKLIYKIFKDKRVQYL